MRTTELFLDPLHPDTVHASLTCDQNLALNELVERSYGPDLVELDELLGAVQHLGYSLPAWSARGLRYCPHCTLVATTEWAVAA